MSLKNFSGGGTGGGKLSCYPPQVRLYSGTKFRRIILTGAVAADEDVTEINRRIIIMIIFFYIISAIIETDGPNKLRRVGVEMHVY